MCLGGGGAHSRVLSFSAEPQEGKGTPTGSSKNADGIDQNCKT